MTRKLKQLIERVEAWPKKAQEEVVESLLAIEEEYITPYALSADDREALERSEEDLRLGKFATDDQIAEVFEQYRRA